MFVVGPPHTSHSHLLPSCAPLARKAEGGSDRDIGSIRSPSRANSWGSGVASLPDRCEGARKRVLACKGLPQLPAISTMPGWPRWTASLSTARELIERTYEEMQEYFDERSEEWQEGEKAADFQERIDEVQAMLDAMTELTF